MSAQIIFRKFLSEFCTSRALLCAITLSVGTIACAQGPAPADPYAAGQDPPNRVARIAWAQGNVSLESNGTDYFAPAEVNYPLTNGDRLYCDLSAVSELQSAGLAVRLGNAADLTITQLTDSAAQFALAQGSIRLRTRDLYAPSAPDGSPQTALDEIDTQNATIVIRQPGDIRVDAYPQDGSSVVTITSGQAEVSGPGFDITLQAGQALRLLGIDQVYPEYVGLLPPDELDQFDMSREQMRQNSYAIRNHYVDPEMIGIADLDQYGDWNPTPQYGPVWFPRSVEAGWSPYSIGHWANVYPWGYTWVDSQPWGFAPFHYGRWNNFGGRWGWVPGPPPSVFRGPGWGGPPPRPVYSPALVAFVGGASFSVSIGGVGVTAWFPLGPSEPYVPWYHTSPAYVNRVNVTNVYNTNVTEIHNTYITRNTTVYNTTNVTYVNRTVATVAVNQHDFASGHSVARSAAVAMNANVRAQLVAAPVLTHAAPPPPKAPTPPPAPARAVPASVARPVVLTRQGFQRAGAPPAATPLKAPTPQPVKAGVAAPAPPRPMQTLAPAKTSVPVARPATAPPAPPAAVSRPAPVAAGRPTPAPAPVAEPPARPAPAPISRPAPAPAPAPAPVSRPAPAPVSRPAPAPVSRPAPAPAPAAPVTRPTPPTAARPAPAPVTRPAPPVDKPNAAPVPQPAPVPLAKPAPAPKPLVAPRPVPAVVPPAAARPATPEPNRKLPPAPVDRSKPVDDKNRPADDKPVNQRPN